MMLKQFIAQLQSSIDCDPEHRPDVGLYRVIICDDAAYGGTNWTYDFYTEIDHNHKVVRIKTECA